MSSGEKYGSQFEGQYDYIALDAQDVSGNGVWFDTSNVRSATITLDQLEDGATLFVMCSNAVNRPSDDADGILEFQFTAAPELRSDILNPTMILFTEKPFRFRKIKKNAGSTPIPTTVLFHGLSR